MVKSSKFDNQQSKLVANCERSALQSQVTVFHLICLSFLVWSVIHNTYVPNTDELVFDELDYDSLVDNPTGGFVDEFSEVAARLVNVDTASKKKAIKRSSEEQLIYRIAETIGCMSSDIKHNMSLDELHEWAAWFELKHEHEKKAAEQAKKHRRS